MTSRDEKLWGKISVEMGEALGLGPISREEAEYEYSLNGGTPLDESEIEEIVRYATGKQKVQKHEVEPSAWQESCDESSVGEGVLQLNRNAGEVSNEVRARIERHRREALADEDEDEDGS